jgi:ABC-type dipeptide/oligopeptide/nickel transport system permease component
MLRRFLTRFLSLTAVLFAVLTLTFIVLREIAGQSFPSANAI